MKPAEEQLADDSLRESGDTQTDMSGNNRRMVKNTGILYVRMLVLMFVSLYTSRVVLNALGVEDFGVNNVVAGFVSMLAFFTSSLSNVSQRYLSIGLGRNDIADTTIVFRQSHTLMLIFSGIVIVLGETIGLWFVCNKLVIPPSRLNAALWIYQFALVSTICSILQVTFNGAIVARERMGIYAYLGIFEVIARLLIAFLISWASVIDHLILYGFLTSFVSALTLIFHIAYCKRNFPEAKCRVCWNRGLAQKMGAFISANLFGCFAWAAGVQGTNVILNLFFGPIVNAARGIAVQVNGVVTRFSDSIMTAMKPQIIKSYACGDLEYMRTLVEKSTKYMSLLTSFLAIPIMFETRCVLQLWLGQVPEYTVAFVRIVLVEQMITVWVSPLWIAANATGHIKRNQVYGRLFTLAALPASYLLLHLVANPMLPMAVLVLSVLGYWIYCLYDIKCQIGLNVFQYLRKSIAPTFIFVALLVAVNFVVVSIIHKDDIVRLLVVGFVTLLSGGVSAYLMLDKNEQIFVKQIAKKLI